MELLIFAVIIAVCVLSAVLFAYSALKNRAENEKIKDTAEAVRESYAIFAKKELMILLAVSAVIFFIFGIFLSWKIALAFIFGAVLSIASIFAGTKTSVKVNAAAAETADESITKPLRIMFSAGMAAGLNAAVLAALGIIVLNYFSNNLFLFYSFGFGFSVTALLSVITRSSYSHGAKAACTEKTSAGSAASSAAHLSAVTCCTGKNINNYLPALAENLVLAIIAAMAVAFMQFEGKAGTLPAAIILSGMLCSIIGSFLARAKKEEKLKSSLRNSFFAAAVLQIIALYYIMGWYTGLMGFFYSVISGVIGGIVLLVLAGIYPSGYHAENSDKPAYASFVSVFLPLLATALVIFVSYYFGGAFGTAIASVGMLSAFTINIAVSIFSGIACSANSIAEISWLGNKVKNRTCSLELAGASASAGSKIILVCSALLVVVSMLGVYANDIQKLAKNSEETFVQEAAVSSGIFSLPLSSPEFFIGLLLGAGVIFLFCSLVAVAARKTSFKITEEIKRQLAQIKGLAKGTAKADYAGCNAGAFNSAALYSVLPVLLVIVSPIAVCFVLGLEALSGMLISIFVVAAGLGFRDASSNCHVKKDCAVGLMSALKFMVMLSLLMVPVFFRLVG